MPTAFDDDSRRTRRSSNVLRNQILAAASELFLRNGYANSVDAVIEKVGGSKRAIYSHFGGKDDLFAAMVTSPPKRHCKRYQMPRRTQGATRAHP